MAIRDDELAVTRLARALVSAYLTSSANGGEAAAVALDGLCANAVLAARPAIESVVHREGEGLLGEAELRLLDALARQGDQASRLIVAALIDSMFDVSPIAEERAVQGLVELSPYSVSALIEALEHEPWRGRAAIALGRCGDGRAVAPLIGLLAVQDPAVRSVAAETLGQLGDPRSAEALFAATQDESHDVRAAAVSALKELSSLLVEIAETWRGPIEEIGGRIRLSGNHISAGRLQLKIDVPIPPDSTSESTQGTTTNADPERSELYQSEPEHSELYQSEPEHSEPDQTEPDQPEPDQPEPGQLQRDQSKLLQPGPRASEGIGHQDQSASDRQAPRLLRPRWPRSNTFGRE